MTPPAPRTPASSWTPIQHGPLCCAELDHSDLEATEHCRYCGHPVGHRDLEHIALDLVVIRRRAIRHSTKTPCALCAYDLTAVLLELDTLLS